MYRKNFLAILAAASTVLCACGGHADGEGGETARKETVYTVEVATVQKGQVPQESYYSATVQANAINNIAPQSASRIQRLRVEVGDFVDAKQIVAEMDRVQLDQAELKLRNSEVELERARQLLSEGGIAQSDFESLELSYNVSKSTYNNLLENTILRSPISGVVSARNYDRGDMYSMGQPIYTVQQIVPVKLLVGVSESDYTRVSRGDKVTLTAEALPGREFPGKIIRLYPVMDAASHTFNVEVQIPNEKCLLRPGMYAKVCINFGENTSLIVPDKCVLKQQGSGQRSVFVAGADNVAESRVVTVGRHFEDKYEILSGLEEGESVVVRGQNTLRNGVKIQLTGK